MCPRRVLATYDGDGATRTRVVDDRLELCMGCGQCAAECPADSLSVEGLPAESFLPARPMHLDYEELAELFLHRRSIRRYRNKSVARDILDRSARAAEMAPAGAGRTATGVLIIDRHDRLLELSAHTYGVYESMQKTLGNPIGRAMVRHKAGALNYEMLRSFVIPGMRWYIKWHKEGKRGGVLRDCPALTLLYTRKWEPTAKEN